MAKISKKMMEIRKKIQKKFQKSPKKNSNMIDQTRSLSEPLAATQTEPVTILYIYQNISKFSKFLKF